MRKRIASEPLVKINVALSESIRKCDSNIKCIWGDLSFQILKIAWFVAGPSMAVAAAFTIDHIENFESPLFLRWKLLFTVNSGVILSQISPQMQPHAANANSRVCGRLHFGCLWAFFLHICAFPRSLSIAIRFTFDIPDYPWRFDKLSESTWPDCRPPRWQSN